MLIHLTNHRHLRCHLFLFSELSAGKKACYEITFDFKNYYLLLRPNKTSRNTREQTEETTAKIII